MKKGLLTVTKKDLCLKLEKKEILDKLPVPSTNVFYFSNLETSEKGDFLRFKKRLFSLSLISKRKRRKERRTFLSPV